MGWWINVDAVNIEVGGGYIDIDAESFLNAPSIDIIYCKECKYHTSDDECTNPHWDSDQDLYPKAMENDFCSYGEREGE